MPVAGNNADAPKKPYETPRLEKYGDIRRITKSLGGTGNLDGGTDPDANRSGE